MNNTPDVVEIGELTLSKLRQLAPESMNGHGKQPCSLCSFRSVSGLVPGHGKCPFHWASGVWGLQWASQLYPEHPDAETKR